MPTMIWKFVDLPVAVPATLFDMNNWSTGCTIEVGDGGEKFDISPPQLRRIRALNNFGDGSLITADSYENRFLKFSVGITGATKTAKATVLGNLETELYKPSNLIMYQPDQFSPPVFFRTYRSDDYVIRNNGGSAEVWQVDLNVEAKPFAIGVRQDIAQVTVNNDPQAASGNKTFWDITGILGDVPTEALVRISDLGASGKAFLATRSMNNPAGFTPFYQAEASTLGTDTTAQTDAGASSSTPGTGNARTNTSFATVSSYTPRLTFNAPVGSDAAALRGKYRVVARITGVTAAANVSIRWKQTSGGDVIPGPPYNADIAPPTWQLADLGIIEFPAPQQTPATIGFSGLTTQHAATPLQIEAARNSGTGGLLIDFVYLLPADERLCAVYQLKSIPSGWIILDGPNDATYGFASGSTPFGATRIVDGQQGIVTRQGGLPMLVPGVTNRWFMLHNQSANNTTETVDISYWPYYREVV